MDCSLRDWDSCVLCSPAKQIGEIIVKIHCVILHKYHLVFYDVTISRKMFGSEVFFTNTMLSNLITKGIWRSDVTYHEDLVSPIFTLGFTITKILDSIATIAVVAGYRP